jgi:hypothetical protein
MNWKFTDETNSFVWRENEDGTQDTRPVNHPSIIAWIADSNTPLPYMSQEEVLFNVKGKRLAEIDARLLQALQQGLEYPSNSGRFLQIRPQDTSNITSASTKALVAKVNGTWPLNFAWIMADNSSLLLATPDDMLTLGEAAFSEVTRLRVVARFHKDAILEIDTKEEVESYDIEDGWE